MRKGLPTALGITVAILVAACPATPPPDPTPSAEAVRAWIDDGRFSDAERLARAWLTEVEAARGVDSLDTAAALDLLVESLWRGGKFSDEATVELAERAIRLKEAADPDGLALAVSLSNMGNIFEGSGDYTESLRTQERVLAIREAKLPWNHVDIADALYNLGAGHIYNGDFSGGRQRYEQALKILEAVDGPTRPRADVLNSLGVLFHFSGDYEMARETHVEALELRRSCLRADHPAIAGSLHNLAASLLSLGNKLEAVDLYEEALSIRLNTLGANHPIVASSLNNLGQLLDELGHPERATELYRQAVANLENSVGDDHPDLALALDTLADRVFRDRDFENASTIYRRALEIQERALGASHPFTGEGVGSLARAQRALGDTANALDNALRSEAISREHLQLTARTMPERQALEYSATRAHGLGLALSICRDGGDTGCAERIWEVVIGSRALVLDEMAVRRRVSSQAADSRLATLAKKLQQAREDLARKFVAGSGLEDPRAYRRALDEARRRAERLEHALAEESSEFREARQRDRTGLEDLRVRLPARTALIAYFAYRYTEAGMAETESIPRYLALAVGIDGEGPSLFDIGSVDDIDRLVAAWQRESAREAKPGNERAVEDEYRTAGKALRTRIWDPLARVIENAEAAFIVPDGALQLVSFATLPVGVDRYLVETGPGLHYLSTERDLLDGPQTDRIARGLVVLGEPAFDSRIALATAAGPGGSARRSGEVPDDSARCTTLQNARFRPLEGLRREVDLITDLWRRSTDSPVTRLTGANASESALKRHAPGARVLHLATHGFFFGTSCLSDSVRRGMSGLTGPAKEVPDNPDALANPLLLSGLALAGANRRHEQAPGAEDGIVTAVELSSLNLEGTEWVVLSACDTGVGQVLPGEGVFGLRRALRIAGARTLIMSLWSVDDDATTEWMAALYRARLVEKLSTSQAVRHASLAMLEARRSTGLSTHPFYWGGFVAVGDWT